MKYYSEVTNKLYDTKKELIDAENAIRQEEVERVAKETKLKEEQEKRHAAVEEAYKIAAEKYDEANKLLAEYLGDYGTFTSGNEIKNRQQVSISPLFDMLFR